MGDPQNGWFIMENPIDLDQGYPHFRKPPSTKCLPCSGNRSHSSWAGIPGSPRSGKAWWELAGEHNLSAREAADDPKSSQLWRWSSLDHFRCFKMARKEYPSIPHFQTDPHFPVGIWQYEDRDPILSCGLWCFVDVLGRSVMFFRCLHLSFWIIYSSHMMLLSASLSQVIMLISCLYLSPSPSLISINFACLDCRTAYVKQGDLPWEFRGFPQILRSQTQLPLRALRLCTLPWTATIASSWKRRSYPWRRSVKAEQDAGCGYLWIATHT